MYPTDLGQQGSLAAGLSSLCLWWEGQGWLARLGRESFRGQGQLSPGPQSQHCVCDRKWTQAAVGSGGRPCRGCPGRAAALPHLGAALLCMSLGTAIRPTPVSSCVGGTDHNPGANSGRPRDDSLVLLAATVSHLQSLRTEPERYRFLMAFWAPAPSLWPRYFSKAN